MSAVSARPQGTMSLSCKVLCAVYGGIAVAAMIGTWSQGGPYLHSATGFFINFWRDTKVTPASRFVTVDVLMLFLAVAILMVIEARKYNVRFVWAYIVGSFFVAGSVAFPLFLLARELKIGRSEPLNLRSVDTILLIVLAMALLALAVWVDAA
jgi:Terpene cyclase DEP1